MPRRVAHASQTTKATYAGAIARKVRLGRRQTRAPSANSSGSVSTKQPTMSAMYWYRSMSRSAVDRNQDAIDAVDVAIGELAADVGDHDDRVAKVGILADETDQPPPTAGALGRQRGSVQRRLAHCFSLSRTMGRGG